MKFSATLDNGSYKIRFSINGQRKNFRPGTSDELEAKKISRQMEYEWNQGNFDLTLERYKLKNKQQRLNSYEKIQIATKPLALLEIWDKWVSSLDLPERTKNNHYHWVRVAIAKVNPAWNETAWLLELKSDLSSSVWNRYRTMIKSCIQWAITEQVLTATKNPYAQLKPKREESKERVKPFSREEIALIISALEDDRFCHPMSPYKHSHYVPLVKFLFSTGCRIGEAIALQWKHIDFARKQVCIQESLSRDIESSPNTTRRVRKERKTGNITYLPLSDSLLNLFVSIKSPDSKGTDLVFKGQKGGSLDPRTFRARVWKPVLEKLQIEYRYPYQARHTVLSHIASTGNLPLAAKVAGHKNLQMVTKHYGRFVGKVELPELV